MQWAEFLEEVAPGVEKEIDNVGKCDDSNLHASDRWILNNSEIQLHCDSDACKGIRTYRVSFKNQKTYPLLNATQRDYLIYYLCNNCLKSLKGFALRVCITAPPKGIAVKIGEI